MDFRKPKIRSLREKGKNKSGGQPNHHGDTLYQSMHPDHGHSASIVTNLK